MRKSSLRHRAIALLVVAALMPGAAAACSVPAAADISQFDGDRMMGFDLSRIRGLGEAMLGENASERAIVSELFAPAIEPLERLPDGDYRCRTIKLGGLLPLVAYGFFDCTVSGKGKLLDKTSGSQRFSGQLLPTEGAIFYVGALHYGDEDPIPYGNDPERDQVGCIYRLAGAERYRLELPSPQFESVHDVIELVPRR